MCLMRVVGLEVAKARGVHPRRLGVRPSSLMRARSGSSSSFVDPSSRAHRSTQAPREQRWETRDAGLICGCAHPSTRSPNTRKRTSLDRMVEPFPLCHSFLPMLTITPVAPMMVRPRMTTSTMLVASPSPWTKSPGLTSSRRGRGNTRRQSDWSVGADSTTHTHPGYNSRSTLSRLSSATVERPEGDLSV